jgi:hypothetical protein
MSFRGTVPMQQLVLHEPMNHFAGTVGIIGTASLWLLLAFCPTPPTKAAAGYESSTSIKVLRYARHLIEQYDTDGDGKLSPEEWKEMNGNPGAIDRNGDGFIEIEELAQYIADYGSVRRIRLMPSISEVAERLPPLLYEGLSSGGTISRQPDATSTLSDSGDRDAPDGPIGLSQRRFTVNPSRLPPGLPAWFQRLDLDGDGQLTQSEFAPTGSPAALQEFDTYDHNRDGVITPQEAVAGPRKVRSTQPDGTN